MIVKQSMLSAAIAFALMAHVTGAQATESGALGDSRSTSYAEQGLVSSDQSDQKAISALYDEAVLQAGQENLRVVYLGFDQFKAKMPASADFDAPLSKDGPRQLVVVDSTFHDKGLMMDLLARGDIIISVGTENGDSAEVSLLMLKDAEDGSGSSRSEADYRADVNVFKAKQSDGQVVAGTVTAHYYAPGGSRSFYIAEENVTAAVTQALSWAKDVALTEKPFDSTSEESRNAPYWTSDNSALETAQRCFYYEPFQGRNIHAGTTSASVFVDRLINDGDTSRNYRRFKYTHEMVPTSNHRNTDSYIWSDIDIVHRDYELIEYSPSTSTGSSSVSVTLGTGVPSVTWSYQAPDVQITNNSTMANDDANWRHDINPWRLIGRSTFQANPGAMVTVPNSWTGRVGAIRHTFRSLWVIDHHGHHVRGDCTVGWNW